MDFSGMTDYRYFLNLGSVTVLASVVTLIITALVKLVLTKRRVIHKGMNVSRKDEVLGNAGRWTAVISYAALYIGSQFYLHQKLVFDGSFLVGILSGGTLSLSVSKAVYTAIHQMGKRQSVYKQLDELTKAQASTKVTAMDEAPVKVEAISAPVAEFNETTAAPVAIATEKARNQELLISASVVKKRWILSSR